MVIRAVVAWFRGLSIRYQVALGVAMAVALVTLAFGLLMVYTLQWTTSSEKAERLNQALTVASGLDSQARLSGDAGEYISDILAQITGSENIVATIIDEKGNILIASGDGDAAGTSPHISLLADLIQARRAGVRMHHVPGASHPVAYAPLESAAGSAVIVEELGDSAQSFRSQLLRIIPFFGIGVLVVTSLSAWVHAHYAVRPLVQLEKAAARIAGGQLDEPVTTTRRDEIGRLAASFDTMRHELKAASAARLWWERQLEQRVRERTEEVHRLVARVINAQEEERRRLAQELHDDTAQALAALLMRIEALRDSVSPDEELIRRHLEPTAAQGAQALEDLRRVIMGLRPAALDDLGLVAALRSYAGAVLVTAGVHLDFSVQGRERRLPGAEEVALFRILQEAMNNIARHARAESATVLLDFQDGLLAASVVDDGRGFDLDQVQARCWGLVGMRERADIVNAKLEVASAPGQGTAVKVELRFEEEIDAQYTGGSGG
jgi:signal transduction histidine kinase